jgi:tetratricopeptide (TPR) repeat protein
MRNLVLPPIPSSESGPVAAWREAVKIETYAVGRPDPNPMFLERRVYQGSSGKVYPLPFYDRVAERSTHKSWDAFHIENKYLRLMILPEIGGRIHVALDKTNGYDFIYRQNVIKPALVGLAGPWISGGIEFNWPQHHRPSTYMPCDVEIETRDDGSKIIWLSEHEPMNRMKGMHGVCLHPDKAYIELKVRLYNRTPITQTFLWWANVATRVHEKYQSFFPSDVSYVVDHAKRAMSRFPQCEDHYYGVNYGQRAQNGSIPAFEAPAQFMPPAGKYAPNDLSWYANIPVPTSYMCMGSNDDFFGGYDHAAHAGIVHVANHHISPGKKQWTWGNHDFGYAWDRNLTDPDENGIYHPYIELMAGVFTDNQPDFSFLAPGETKTFSQFWYPIQKIGPSQKANIDAAVSLRVTSQTVHLGVCVTSEHDDAKIVLFYNGAILADWNVNLLPGLPLLQRVALPSDVNEANLVLTVQDHQGRELITYRPQQNGSGDVPPAATEIPAPEDIASADELYLSGIHLQQYRHATRCPEIYWREALRRDPMDSRCNNAMGLWHLRRGEFEQAAAHFQNAIKRLTHRNPNPSDGEPYYNLGLALRYLGRDEQAYSAFYKSTWNAAWRAPAFFALAELDCRQRQWATALDHLNRVLKVDVDHLQARDLKAIVLRELKFPDQANALLRETLTLDPLDWSARYLLGQPINCDTQVCLDLALDYLRSGLWSHAASILESSTPESLSGTAPLVNYYLAQIYEHMGQTDHASRARRIAAEASPDYCFPSRLDEIAILRRAAKANPNDARAPYYLGNLFYDRQRYDDAIAFWEQSAGRDPSFAIVWRNLGIAYFNTLGSGKRASAAYDQAVACDSQDARLLYEHDQLRKRVGEAPRHRLAALSGRLDLVQQRGDLTIELCALYNQTAQHEQALNLISLRQFQPWEGGEGLVLAEYVRTHLALGRLALDAGNPARARKHFEAALHSPNNLGETKHLLANQSHIHYWLGIAFEAIGDVASARRYWTVAANASGDFQNMSVRPYSEMSYYSALSLEKLGAESQAHELLNGLLKYADSLINSPAKIDYFATSLPTMLLFNDDLDQRQRIYGKVLKSQAMLGLQDEAGARRLLREILDEDPNHPVALDLYNPLISSRAESATELKAI